MNKIKIEKENDGQMPLIFPYDSQDEAKVKNIPFHRWHPDKKYWSFPDTEGTLKKILKVFEDEENHLNPCLQGTVPDLPTGQIKVVESSLSRTFEDVRRELISSKSSSDIDNADIKNYLYYLTATKKSFTSTLNQAINALKFYYGSMLKKKFIYEIKRPSKDKKLPIVLSKDEVVRILDSVDNLKHRAILIIAYSSGLRVSEVVKLKPEDNR